MSDTDWIEDTPLLPVIRMDHCFSTKEQAHSAISNVAKTLVKDRAAIMTVDAHAWRESKRVTWGRTKLERRNDQVSKFGDRASLGAFSMWWVHKDCLEEVLRNFDLEVATDFNLTSFAAWIGIDTHKASPHRRFAAMMTHTDRESADRLEWAEASLYRIFIVRKKHTGAASSLVRKMRHFLAI